MATRLEPLSSGAASMFYLVVMLTIIWISGFITGWWWGRDQLDKQHYRQPIRQDAPIIQQAHA